MPQPTVLGNEVTWTQVQRCLPLCPVLTRRQCPGPAVSVIPVGTGEQGTAVYCAPEHTASDLINK